MTDADKTPNPSDYVVVPREPTDDLACNLLGCHPSRLTAGRRDMARVLWWKKLATAAAPDTGLVPVPRELLERASRWCRLSMLDASVQVAIEIDAILAAQRGK